MYNQRGIIETMHDKYLYLCSMIQLAEENNVMADDIENQLIQKIKKIDILHNSNRRIYRY